MSRDTIENPGYGTYPADSDAYYHRSYREPSGIPAGNFGIRKHEHEHIEQRVYKCKLCKRIELTNEGYCNTCSPKVLSFLKRRGLLD